MSADAADPVLAHHFSVLIYPFLHDLGEGPSRRKRLAALSSLWSPWWAREGEPERRWDSWAEAPSPASSKLRACDLFLPHVRALLFPETELHRGRPSPEWLEGQCVASLAELLPEDAVLHLTAGDDLHRSLQRWAVAAPRRRPGRPTRSIQARLEWLDLYLFRGHRGFLAFKFRLDDAAPRLSTLMELNAMLRALQPLQRGDQAPLLSLHGGPERVFGGLIDELIGGLAEPALGHGQRCFLTSYACAPGAASAPYDPGVFDSGADRVLHEFATGLKLNASTADPTWAPTREQAQALVRDHRFNDWRCWRGMMLKDGCFYLATEDIRFATRSLACAIELSYLPLHLFTLHQHVQLLGFTSGLTLEVARTALHHDEARQLYREFMAFRHRYWFNVTTTRPQLNRLYHLMQRGLEVPQTFEMVAANLRGAKEHYGELWDRDLGKVKMFAPGLTGGLMAALGSWSMWVKDHGWSWLWVAAMWAALLTGGLLWLYLILPANSPLLAKAASCWRRVAGWARGRRPAPPVPCAELEQEAWASRSEAA